MNEPSSKESSSGRGSVPSSTLMRGTRTYSAKPPGWKWVWRRVSHTEGWPCRQYRHSPQGTWWVTKTRSPARKRSTPSPTASTSPATSWPRTSGAERARYHSMTSLPQIPLARTRRSISPGPMLGTGISSTRTSWRL